VKYYDNIRLVYEFESRVREFKRATTPEEPAHQEERKDQKNNTSGDPQEKQERNYSQSEDQPVLASAPVSPALVTVTTPRRLA
jgi:hypothetical protein